MGDTNSSFYADGGVYDTGTVTSNDVPNSQTPSAAPSSMYPGGTIYNELLDTNVVAEAEAIAAASAASATAAAASATAAAGSVTSAAAILAEIAAELATGHFTGDLTVDGHITAGGYISAARTSGFKLGAATVLTDDGTGYTMITDTAGNARIDMDGATIGWRANYYYAEHHEFYDLTGTILSANIDGAGIAIFQGGASTSTTTGALRVTGGAGISGDLHLGGTLTATAARSAGGVLRLAGGDDSASYANPTITFGYNNGDHFRHWLHTRHNSGAGAGNAFDFYTCDSTEFGTFPTNGVLGLTIENGNVIAPNALDVRGTTASTSTTTGALHVAGGVGIEGDLNTSGMLWVNTSNALASGGPTVTVGPSITPNAIDPYYPGLVTFSIQNDPSQQMPFSTVVYNDNPWGAGFAFGKTRNASPNGHTAVVNGDQLGYFASYGSDGSSFVPTAGIYFNVDGTVSGSVVPTCVEIWSGVNGYGTRRLRVNSAGDTSVLNTTASTSTTTGALTVAGGLGVAGALNVGGGIGVTGAINGYVADGSYAAVLHGTTLALRVEPNPTYVEVAATDYTGSASYQPLYLSGSTVTLNAGPVSIPDTTSSTSTTTGALKVAGGVGIVENLNVGGKVTSGGFSQAILDGAGSNYQAQNDGLPWALSSIVYGNSANGPGIGFAKTRGVNPTTHGAVLNSDPLFAFYVYPSDGANFVPTGAFGFSVEASGAIGSFNVPTKFGISTGVNNYGIERFTIGSDGVVSVLNTTASTSPTTGALKVAGGVGIAGVMNVDGQVEIVTGGLIIGYPGSVSGKRVQIHGSNSNESSWLDIINWGNIPGNAAVFTTRKSASGTIGVHTALANNEFVSDITQLGSDGTTFGELTCIRTYADAAGSSGSTPGRLNFWTTPTGTATSLERMRIDKDGLITIGGGANRTGARLEVHGLSAAQGQVFGARWDASSANSVAMVQAKSRGGAIGTHTIVQNGDNLGLLWAQGSDGVAFQSATQIISTVDGVPGVGSMPARLTFLTTPSGSVVPVERMRIDSSGNVSVVGAASAATAAVDTNTTQLATTAYVLAQAGGSNPLAAGTAAPGTSTRWSRQDHVHPTDTTRAATASPTFTGTPAAPTAAVDTNTTQLATTAFVLAQAASATPAAQSGSGAVGTSTRFARGDHVHPDARTATSALGYATGSGGAVTQATSKTTGVTLNTLCGQVTTNAAALAAGAKATFIVTNSTTTATDVVVACVQSAATSQGYRVSTNRVVAGSFSVTLENITAGSLSEAVVINYATIRAAAS